MSNLPSVCQQGGGGAGIHDLKHCPGPPLPRDGDTVGSHFYLKDCLPEKPPERFGLDRAIVKILAFVYFTAISFFFFFF